MDKKRDKELAWVYVRYILFYLAFIFVLSLSTFTMDWIFSLLYLKHGSFRTPVFQYVFFYMILGIGILPFSVLYNYIVNNLLPPHNIVRILGGTIIVLLFGALLSMGYDWGYYLGKNRVLKNIIAQALSGILVELLRIWVVKSRWSTIKK